MKRVAAIAILLSLAMTSQLFALDRYIDPVNGNNTNSGTTAGSAWKTITFAVEELDGANGTLENPVHLFLAAGTYGIDSGEDFPIQVPAGVGYLSLEGAGSSTIIDGTGGDAAFQIDDYNAYYAFVMDYFSLGIELNYMHFQYFEGILGAYYVEDRIKITYVDADNFIDFEENNGDGSDLDDLNELNDLNDLNDLDDHDIWQSAIGVRWGNAQVVLENVNIDGAYTPGSGGAFFINECNGDIQIINSTFSNSFSQYYGGAIAIMNGGATTLENVEISDCSSEWRAGGGMAILNMGGTVNMQDVNIDGCDAYLAGGGFVMLQVTAEGNVFNNISIEDCQVDNGSGGGIYMTGIADEDIVMTGLSLCNNLAENGDGGGMYCGSPILGWGTVEIDSFTVLGNVAGYYGGGMFMEYYDIELTNGTFYENRSDGHGNGNSGGGGLYIERSWLNFLGISLTLDDIIFWGNESYSNGGGLYVDDKSNHWTFLRGIDIDNTVFLNNISHHGNGGGAFLAAGHTTESNEANIIKNVLAAGNHADKKGGAFYFKYANPDLVNVTMTENTADQSDASFRYQRRSYDMEVYNSIIWGNGDLGDGTEITYSDASHITFAYSNVEYTGGAVIPGEGNVNTSPLFVSPEDQVFYPYPGSLMYDAGMPLDPEDPHPYADYSFEPNADEIDTVYWGDGPTDFVVIELNDRVDMGYSYQNINGAGPNCEHCGVKIKLPSYVYNDPTSGDPGGGSGSGTADIPPNPNPYLPSKLVVRDDYFFLGIPVLPNTDLYQELPRVSFGDDLNNTLPSEWTPDPYTQSWRISRWVNHYPDPDTPGEFYTGYLRYLENESNGREMGDPPALAPGLGFWFVYNYAASEDDMLWIDVLKHMLDPVPYVLPLESAVGTQPSINMMANPWPFPIDWAQVEIKNITTDSDWLAINDAADMGWINRYAYAWNSSERDYFEVTGRLDSWQGFFLMTYTTDSLNVRFQAEQVSTTMPQMAGLDELDEILDWSLMLTARRTDALQVDYHNWIGVGATLDDSLDSYDAFQMSPMAKEAIFLRTRVQTETGALRERLSYDFRSNTYDNNGNKAWLTELWFYSSPDNGNAYPIDVKVQWPTISSVPGDVSFSIHEVNGATFDPENDAVIIPDMRTQGSLIANVDGAYGSNYMYTRFWIVASTGVEPDVDVEDVSTLIPLETRLADAYPNPFNASTNIRFELHKAADINLQIFNVMGQQVGNLVNTKHYNAGYYQVSWDAHNQASGIYFVRFTTDTGVVQSRKIMLVR